MQNAFTRYVAVRPRKNNDPSTISPLSANPESSKPGALVYPVRSACVGSTRTARNAGKKLPETPNMAIVANL
jgi:hypothetical protein